MVGDTLGAVKRRDFGLLRFALLTRIIYFEGKEVSLSLQLSELMMMVEAKTPNPSSSRDDSGRRTSFSNLITSADLEAHRLAFLGVDLPLSHPEILMLCPSYAVVDPSFVPKLTRVEASGQSLIMKCVGRVMGMFLAFPPGKVPLVVHQYMVTLEKLSRLVAKALGFELSLLQRIVANSRTITQPLVSPRGRDQLLHRPKRRRISIAKPSFSV